MTNIYVAGIIKVAGVSYDNRSGGLKNPALGLLALVRCETNVQGARENYSKNFRIFSTAGPNLLDIEIRTDVIVGIFTATRR